MNAKANNTIDKARKLQRKLYLSAKVNKKRRFHALYDKIYRADILLKAWKQVKANKGTSGIDNIYINDVINYGENKFLKELQQNLKDNMYKATPVKRIYIPKKDGKKRPLGIPIIKDRVVQMATKIVIEPIFEADFKEYSYGFRPKRNAHGALEVIRKECNKGRLWVLDADIVSYFDNINHDKLMILISMRISDRRILKLIRKWLESGIIENGTYRDSNIGSPQGGVISPLLSNIYLNYFDTVWDKYYKHLGKPVKYADDLVVISRTKKEIHHVYKAVEKIFERLELKLHPDKTRIVNMWNNKEGFDFLGFHHRKSIEVNRKGQRYATTIQIPTKKAMKSMKENIKKVLGNRAILKMDMHDLIQIINRKIIGMKNYYKLTYATKQLSKIDWYIVQLFTIWYNHKKQRKPRHTGIREVMDKLRKMGLVKLSS